MPTTTETRTADERQLTALIAQLGLLESIGTLADALAELRAIQDAPAAEIDRLREIAKDAWRRSQAAK